MKTTTQKEAAASARQRGESRFVWTCETHGETEHYSKSRGACVKCCSERNRRNHAHRMATPEGREARRNHQRERHNIPEVREATNAYHRSYHATRMTQDPTYAADMRAKAVNNNTIRRIRDMDWLEEAPPRAMPGKEILRECAEFVKHAPADAEIDHGIPLKGYHPVTGAWIVSGLHVPWNLEPMQPRSNNLKNRWFDPERPLEFQKPYNSFPGGQFHGDIGEIEFMRYTQPTTLELMTVSEWRQAIIDGGNEDMTEWAAQWDDRHSFDVDHPST